MQENHQRLFQSVGFITQYVAARCPAMSVSTASGGRVSS